jgi:ADP-heptose:LPS heptosyltransferase
MDESAETNPAVVDKKIIVIKLPSDPQDRLLSFPFLHLLHQYYSESEFHFILNSQNMEVLNLLPFRAYYHEFDEKEVKNIFQAHRYAVHAKIYKVDLFISLTDSLIDASLGLSLKAKIRLGFSDGWKTFCFNQKILRPLGHHRCEDYFALLKEHLGHDVDTHIRVISRDLPAVIETWDSAPYLALNLSSLNENNEQEAWIELISHFENQRFIFFATEDQDKIQFLMNTFLSRLPKTNVYETFLLKNWIDIAKMTSYAKGVITFNGPGATLTAYSGTKCIVIYNREDPQVYGPLYFLADVVILNQKGAIDMGLVADKAHEFFKL